MSLYVCMCVCVVQWQVMPNVGVLTEEQVKTYIRNHLVSFRNLPDVTDEEIDFYFRYVNQTAAAVSLFRLCLQLSFPPSVSLCPAWLPPVG